VSASSIVDFKAAVASEKEDRTSTKARRIAGHLDVSDRNKGVMLRAKKDEQAEEELKNRYHQDKIESKLREKSQIYDKFVRGENLNPEEMEKAGYLVDFEQKSWNKEDDNVPSSHFFHEDIHSKRRRAH